MEFPRIYLAADNCFASKRWTIPSSWMSIIKDGGIRYIEASADNECDPLYSDSEYIRDWLRDVQKNSERLGLEIANLYSGHGTYSTLGLAHTDVRYRDHFLTKWVYALIDNAAYLGANVGFFCHAFDETVLQNPELYRQYQADLLDRFEKIADYAAKKQVIPCVEQMYSPHQYPWRVSDCYDVLKSMSLPFYITIDVGHQFGQKRFLRPTAEKLLQAIEEKTPIYAGPYRAFQKQYEAIRGKISAKLAIEEILEDCENYGYLFAEEKDSDVYYWLRKLGCYSPIIHLQQTDNTASQHHDFTHENNKTGLISGEKVLKSIYESYLQPQKDDMPPRAKEIFLTLELFYGTAEYNHDIINRYIESAAYWRKFIPEDGLRLDRLISLLEDGYCPDTQKVI